MAICAGGVNLTKKQSPHHKVPSSPGPSPPDRHSNLPARCWGSNLITFAPRAAVLSLRFYLPLVNRERVRFGTVVGGLNSGGGISGGGGCDDINVADKIGVGWAGEAPVGHAEATSEGQKVGVECGSDGGGGFPERGLGGVATTIVPPSTGGGRSGEGGGSEAAAGTGVCGGCWKAADGESKTGEGLKRGGCPREKGRSDEGNSTPRAENSCDLARVVPEGSWPLGGAAYGEEVGAGASRSTRGWGHDPPAKWEGPSPRLVWVGQVEPGRSG